MAAKKKATPRKPGAQGRAKASNYGGFGSRALQRRAAAAYYGKASNITHVKASQVDAMLASQGLNQGQPVNLGGVRFYDTAGKITSSGERSDLAKKKPGAAYNAPASQQSYINGFGAGAKKPKKRARKTARRRSSAPDTQHVSADYIGQGFSTTSNVRAQGKAYALGQEGFGGSFLGESSQKNYGGAADLGFGGEGLGSTVGKKNVKKKSTQRKITQAKKAGNFQKAQKIRARARKR